MTDTLTEEFAPVETISQPNYFIADTAEDIYAERVAPPLELGQTGPGTPRKAFDAKIIFFLGLLLAGSGLVSPPVALFGGIAFGP